MQTSEEINEISSALVEAQKEMTPIKSTRENTFLKSKYATLADVKAGTFPALHAHGISVIKGSGESESGTLVTCRLLHKSGQWIQSSVSIPTTKKDAQAIGSAITYGERYLLKAMTGACSDEEDDDGQAASQYDPKADRSQESLNPITDKQIRDATELFVNLAASTENVEATVARFTGNRAVEVEAMMSTEAKCMISALMKKRAKNSVVEPV